MILIADRCKDLLICTELQQTLEAAQKFIMIPVVTVCVDGKATRTSLIVSFFGNQSINQDEKGRDYCLSLLDQFFVQGTTSSKKAPLSIVLSTTVWEMYECNFSLYKMELTCNVKVGEYHCWYDDAC